MAGFCWTPSARSWKQDSVSDALGVLLLREFVVVTERAVASDRLLEPSYGKLDVLSLTKPDAQPT